MLKNAYLLANIGADTTENERNCAGHVPNFATTLRVPARLAVADLDCRDPRATDRSVFGNGP